MPSAERLPKKPQSVLPLCLPPSLPLTHQHGYGVSSIRCTLLPEFQREKLRTSSCSRTHYTESLNGRTPAALGRRGPWGGPHLSQLLCWGRASQPFCSFICPGRVTSHATSVFSQMCCYWGALWYMEMKDAGLIQSFIIYLFIYFVLLLIVKLPSTLWQPRQKSCDASSFLQE